MIIITQHKLEVGKKYPPPGVYATLTDGNRVEHIIPFIVIREATVDEWLNYCTEMSASPSPALIGDRFYEVTTD